MIVGSPPSRTAMAELVVPRSIPIILLISITYTFLYGFPCRFTLHIMKSKCPIVKFYKPFLIPVTNTSYSDILSIGAGRMLLAYVGGIIGRTGK